jgi:hypothetical protein
MAQEAPESTFDADDGDVVVLVPFIVSGEEDSGSFRATATIGGWRIRSDMSDIASPLSVITSQVL